MKAINLPAKRLAIALATITGVALGGAFSTAPSHAAGDGGGTVSTPSCKRGHVWNKRKKKCVRVKKSSSLTDDNIYEAARDLAYNKRYDEAITLLKLGQKPERPAHSQLSWLFHPQVWRC